MYTLLLIELWLHTTYRALYLIRHCMVDGDELGRVPAALNFLTRID